MGRIDRPFERAVVAAATRALLLYAGLAVLLGLLAWWLRGELAADWGVTREQAGSAIVAVYGFVTVAHVLFAVFVHRASTVAWALAIALDALLFTSTLVQALGDPGILLLIPVVFNGWMLSRLLNADTLEVFGRSPRRRPRKSRPAQPPEAVPPSAPAPGAPFASGAPPAPAAPVAPVVVAPPAPEPVPVVMRVEPPAVPVPLRDRLVGQANDGREAHSVARARNALIVVALVSAYLFRWTFWAHDPPPSVEVDPDVLELLRVANKVFFVQMVGGAVAAFGVHRLWMPAWAVAVAGVAYALVQAVFWLVRYNTVEMSIAVVVPMIVLGYLLDPHAVRPLTRLGRRKLAPPETVELVTWSLPVVRPTWAGPPPPAPGDPAGGWPEAPAVVGTYPPPPGAVPAAAPYGAAPPAAPVGVPVGVAAGTFPPPPGAPAPAPAPASAPLLPPPPAPYQPPRPPSPAPPPPPPPPAYDYFG